MIICSPFATRAMLLIAPPSAAGIPEHHDIGNEQHREREQNGMVRQASAESVPMWDTFPITSSPMPSPSPSRSSITSTPTAPCTFLTMPVRFCLGVPGRPVIIDHVVERRVLLLPGLADSLLDKAEMLLAGGAGVQMPMVPEMLIDCLDGAPSCRANAGQPRARRTAG